MSASNHAQSPSPSTSGTSPKKSGTATPVRGSAIFWKPSCNKQEKIPIKELKRLFDYNVECGCLSWAIAPPRKAWLKGCRPGYTTSHGYRSVTTRFQGVPIRLYEHQIVWAMHYGYWSKEIDHINGCGLDNRLINLRDVNTQINRKNMKRYSNNTSGVVGVSWSNKYNKWRAYIKINGKQKHISYCDSFDDAVAARKAAEVEYGYHENHGRN